MRKTKKSKRHYIAVFIFVVYIVVLFYLLFFAESMGRTNRHFSYNVKPFKEIKRFYEYRNKIGMEYFILNVFGNIVAFVPFGFFLPEINKKFSNVFVVVAAGLLFSLGVELLQLHYHIGSFDVDDIFLNTSGTFAGYIIFKVYAIIRKIQRFIQRKD